MLLSSFVGFCWGNLLIRRVIIHGSEAAMQALPVDVVHLTVGSVVRYMVDGWTSELPSTPGNQLVDRLDIEDSAVACYNSTVTSYNIVYRSRETGGWPRIRGDKINALQGSPNMPGA